MTQVTLTYLAAKAFSRFTVVDVVVDTWNTQSCKSMLSGSTGACVTRGCEYFIRYVRIHDALRSLAQL